MVVSPRCLERKLILPTPSHHQCEGRPPPKPAARRALSNCAVASAAGLGGLGARYPIYIPVLLLHQRTVAGFERLGGVFRGNRGDLLVIVPRIFRLLGLL